MSSIYCCSPDLTNLYSSIKVSFLKTYNKAWEKYPRGNRHLTVTRYLQTSLVYLEIVWVLEPKYLKPQIPTSVTESRNNVSTPYTYTFSPRTENMELDVRVWDGGGRGKIILSVRFYAQLSSILWYQQHSDGVKTYLIVFLKHFSGKTFQHLLGNCYA